MTVPWPVEISTPTSGSVSGLLDLPAGGAAHDTPLLVLGHGAGGDLHSPLLRALAQGLAGSGVAVLRFNFPYRERGSRAPDRPPVLAATWLAAWQAAAELLPGPHRPRFAAGKSMGGRLAAQCAADGLFRPAGLVFYGYPLHPAGREERLRDGPLLAGPCPMLFFSGTRDRLCRLELLDDVLAGVEAPHTVQVVEGGDHSFRVPKAFGLDEATICARLVTATARWIGQRAAPGGVTRR